MELAFLDASQVAADAAAHRERQRLSRLRFLVAGLGALAVVAVVAGALALVQQRRATEEAELADQRARTATARGLAAQSAALLSTELDTALLLAANATAVEESPDTERGLLNALHGATGLVATMPFPDGDEVLAVRVAAGVLVAGYRDGTIRSFDPETVAPLGPTMSVSVASGAELLSLHLSGDGRYLATASADGVVVFEILTGETVLSGIGTDRTFPIPGLSATGRFLSIVDAREPEPIVDVFDLVSGQALGRVRLDGPIDIGVPAFSADERRLIVAKGNADGVTSTAAAWRLPSLEPLAEPVTIDVGANEISPSPGRDKAALLGFIPAAVTMVDPESFLPVGPTIDLEAGRLAGTEWNPSGTLLLVATLTGELVVVDGGTGAVVARVTGRADQPVGGGWLDNERFLSVAAGRLMVWDLTVQSTIATPAGDGALFADSLGDGRYVVRRESAMTIVDLDGTTTPLRVDDLDACGPFQYEREVGRLLLSCAIAGPDGEPVRHFAVVDLATGRQTGELVEREGNVGVFAAAISPDGSMVAGVGTNQPGGFVLVLDAHTGENILPPTQLDDWVMSAVGWRPDGSALLAGGQAGDLFFIDPSTWDILDTVSVGTDAAITDLAFEPSGAVVHVATERGEVWAVDLVERRTIGDPLGGQTGQLQSLDLSPDGSRVAAVARDGAVRLWDVDTGRPLSSKLDAANAFAVSFVDDDTLLTSGDEVLLWRLGLDDLQARACELAGRTLTTDEWQLYAADTKAVDVCDPGRDDVLAATD